MTRGVGRRGGGCVRVDLQQQGRGNIQRVEERRILEDEKEKEEGGRKINGNGRTGRKNKYGNNMRWGRVYMTWTRVLEDEFSSIKEERKKSLAGRLEMNKRKTVEERYRKIFRRQKDGRKSTVEEEDEKREEEKERITEKEQRNRKSVREGSAIMEETKKEERRFTIEEKKASFF